MHEMTAAFEKKFGYRPGITMSNARTFYAQVRKALETGDSID